MNKTQIIAAITALYDIANPAQLTETIGNVKTYTLPVWDITGDNIVKSGVGFVVVDEGLPGEVAYYRNAAPNVENKFLKDVDTFIAAKILDNTVEAAFVISMDIAHETASFTAYRIAANLLQKFEGIFFREVGGAIAYRLIGT